MTKRDEMRVEKALQGAGFPASREQLIQFATEREADAETLAALRAIPAAEYADKDQVVDAVPQEPEGRTTPGGTERG